jgi:hypothetical protein
VRRRGGEWADRDGTFFTHNKLKAWSAVRELIGDGTQWKRVDQVESVAHG